MAQKSAGSQKSASGSKERRGVTCQSNNKRRVSNERLVRISAEY